MRKFLITASLILSALSLSAQTSNVSGTVEDTDGTFWAAGSWKVVFQPGPSDPNIQDYNINGTPLSPSVLNQSGSLTAGSFPGQFTFTVYQNGVVSPAGSFWLLTLCPNASSACGTFSFTTNASTLVIGSGLITNSIPVPRFQAKANSYGYADIEAITQNTAGSTYWNVTSGVQRCYNNVTPAWGVCSAGGSLQNSLQPVLNSTSVSTMKIVCWGDSTCSNATELFQELATHCKTGDALAGFACTPETDSSGLPVTLGNIYNYGNSGFTLAQLIANSGSPPFPLSSLISLAPGIVYMRVGTNDVRQGLCNRTCLTGLYTTALTTLIAALPNVQVILPTGNSFLSTDPGNYGFIVPVATTSTTAVASTGSQTVTLATMPDSIYYGAQQNSSVPPAQVTVDTGANQETVTITGLTTTTITATFTKTHSSGFAVVATVATASQAYSYIMRSAALAMQNTFSGNLNVIDTQASEYGTTAPPLSPYMLNSLHPSPFGRIAEADMLADWLLQIRNNNAFPALKVPGTTLANYANYQQQFTAGQILGSDISNNQFNLNVLDGANGTWRGTTYKTASNIRWICGANNAMESGSNVGSDYNCDAYDDSQAFLGIWLSIARATGKTTLSSLGVTNNAQVGSLTVNSYADINPGVFGTSIDRAAEGPEVGLDAYYSFSAGSSVSAPDTVLGRVSPGLLQVQNDPGAIGTGSFQFSQWLPGTIYSKAGTILPTCAVGIVGSEAVVSDATALVPGTAYVPSATVPGSDTVRVQCTLAASTYAWQTM